MPCNTCGAKSQSQRDRCHLFIEIEEGDEEYLEILINSRAEEEELEALAGREQEEEGFEWLSTQEETRRLVQKWEKDYGELAEEMMETDFERCLSESEARIEAAVKEGDEQRAQVKRLQAKLANSWQETRALLRGKDEKLAIAEMENQCILKERDAARAKYKRLVEQMEEKLVCQVCLMVPRLAPVLACKQGHLACSTCLHAWVTGGRNGCPYRHSTTVCKAELLVGAKSLLADLIIQNIEHECSLVECSQRVPLKDFAEHQRRCQFRLVKCPGRNRHCSLMVPFCQVVPEHVRECPDMSMCQHPDKTISFSFLENSLDSDLWWNTIVIQNVLGTFFLRVEKIGSLFTLEVAMKATEEESERVNVEITIKDAFSGKPAFKCTHHPRPLSKENTKEFCLSVTQAALAKTWTCNKDLKIVFFVDIKTTVA